MSTDDAHWFTGDLQHHEDGTVPITEHCRRVREAGYDFICLQYKDMEDPARIVDAAQLSSPDFLVIPGAEQAFQSRRGLWAHFGFFPFTPPMPDTTTDDFNVPQGLAEAERRHPGCLKVIHHPADQRWILDDVRDAYAGGARFLELNPEKTPMQSAVDLWDTCLTDGMLLYANLSSDAHGLGGIRRRGYVAVCLPELSQDGVLQALERGEHVAVEEGCAVKVKRVRRPQPRAGAEYVIDSESAVWTRFVGGQGRLLAISKEQPAVYTIQGDEDYVRAELLDSKGLRVFTQPTLMHA